MLAFPAALLGFELFDHAVGQEGTVLQSTKGQDRFSQRPGKRIYLASVCGLYSALLLALRDGHTVLVAALTTASSLFHAVEYLAVVTHYAWGRQTGGSAGLFRMLAGRWLLVLVSYVVLFGLSAAVLHRLGAEVWVGLNIWAAFLHYAYDGMIWKLRRPDTARALGAVSAAASP